MVGTTTLVEVEVRIGVLEDSKREKSAIGRRKDAWKGGGRSMYLVGAMVATFVLLATAEVTTLTELEVGLTAEEVETGALTEELAEEGGTTRTTDEAFVGAAEEVVGATEEMVGLITMLEVVGIGAVEMMTTAEVVGTALQNADEQ